MQFYLLAFSIGALSSAFWPCLSWSEFSWDCAPFLPQLSIIFLLLGPWCLYRQQCPSWVRAILVLVLGLVWAAVWGESMKARQLPLVLDKTDYQLTGVVRGVPQRSALRTRFLLEVETLRPIDTSRHENTVAPTLQRVMLSWYGGETVLPGERWQFKVRLRTPRGFSNPGGFDYAGWLFHQGISATGYVRSPGLNKKLEQTGFYKIDKFRTTVLKRINNLNFTTASKSLLAALTVGDKQGLDSETWMNLRLTGTVHLAIVSGLHIGMIAGLGVLLGNVLGRCLVALSMPVTRQQVGVLIGGCLAISYALLAGFSLSTQRALIMLSVFLLATLLKRKPVSELPFLWALAIVAASDPLAALSSGFWLSFAAVAIFLLWFIPRPRCSYGRSLLTAQLIIFLPLAGLLSFFQGEISLLTPFVNLLAIPWLGITVVPLALLGMFILPVSESTADSVWSVAAWQLEWFDRTMGELATYADFYVWSMPVEQGVLSGLAILLAGVLILLPRGLGLRWMSLVLLLAVILAGQPFVSQVDRGREDTFTENALIDDTLNESALDENALTIAVLDVGQGLSVVVKTANSAMVYDAGPRFSDGFNAGTGIIVPYLRSEGISQLNMLMVSHSDADHSGGTLGLLEAYIPLHILAGQPKMLPVRAVKGCLAGQRWERDGVVFEVLYPLSTGKKVSITGKSASDNDASCVLLIRYQGHAILLPGDISAEAEVQLLNSGMLPSNIDVLVAPHHGSKTSSSQMFVNHVSPRHVVYSVGFHHHFGHPHRLVAQRYEKIGAQAWTTGDSGAVIFKWHRAGALSAYAWRDKVKHYWY